MSRTDRVENAEGIARPAKQILNEILATPAAAAK
jgi:hypothetical protein